MLCSSLDLSMWRKHWCKPVETEKDDDVHKKKLICILIKNLLNHLKMNLWKLILRLILRKLTFEMNEKMMHFRIYYWFMSQEIAMENNLKFLLWIYLNHQLSRKESFQSYSHSIIWWSFLMKTKDNGGFLTINIPNFNHSNIFIFEYLYNE